MSAPNDPLKPLGNQKSRRSVLSCALGGSGLLLSESIGFQGWTPPVIKTVLLPAHAATSVSSGRGAPVASGQCEIQGPASIALVDGGGSLTPSIPITIINTGSTPLSPNGSGPSAGLQSGADPALGATQFNYALNGGIPNPLAPGQSHTFQLVALFVANCPANGSISITYEAGATNCELTIPVECTVT